MGEPEPMEANLSFALDGRQYDVSLPVAAGDNSAVLVRALLAKEKLPEALAVPLTACVEGLRESEQRHAHRQYAKAVAAASTAVTREQLEGIEQRFRARLDWFQDDDKGAQNSLRERARFAEAFQSLLQSGATMRETLRQIEASHRSAIKDLLERRSNALSQVKEKHARTAQAILQTDPERAQDVLSSQREELQVEEANWDNEVAALKSQQREDFRLFVVETHGTQGDRRGGSQRSTVEEPDSEENQSDLTTERDANASTGTGAPSFASFFSKTNALMRKGLQKLPLIQGGNEMEQTKTLDAETSPEHTYTIWVGTQRKSPIQLRLIHNTGMAGTSQQRKETLATLYDEDKLHALMMFVDPLLRYKGSQLERQFVEHCMLSSEVHFEAPESIIGDSRAASEKAALRSGDFFITKHSTLPRHHLVYHIVSAGDRTSDVSQLCARLPRHLTHASTNGICSVTIPTILATSDSVVAVSEESKAEFLDLSYSNTICLLRAVKQALFSPAVQEGSIREIEIAIPTTASLITKGVRRTGETTGRARHREDVSLRSLYTKTEVAIRDMFNVESVTKS